MKRTFGVNVLLCPRCQTLMVLRALVRTHEVSRKLLVDVLGLPWEPELLRIACCFAAWSPWPRR